jgi:hypothetical protein
MGDWMLGKVQCILGRSGQHEAIMNDIFVRH